MIAFPGPGRGQVYCGNAAQRVGSFAQGWRIGARARYLTDREPDFRKRLLCAHRAEGICCSKDRLEIGASRFQADDRLIPYAKKLANSRGRLDLWPPGARPN
jgi:hypothetical protein